MFYDKENYNNYNNYYSKNGYNNDIIITIHPFEDPNDDVIQNLKDEIKKLKQEQKKLINEKNEAVSEQETTYIKLIELLEENKELRQKVTQGNTTFKPVLDPWKIIGCDKNDPKDKIKHALKKAMIANHPDMFVNAHIMIQQISHEILVCLNDFKLREKI